MTPTKLSLFDRTTRAPTRGRTTLAQLPRLALPATAFPVLLIIGCVHDDATSADSPSTTTLRSAPAKPKAAPAELTVTAAQERPAMPGPADWFTGETTVSMLFSPAAPRDFGGANVRFEPGARTAWHSHPAGQTLVVTDGAGWVQVEGGPRQEIFPGDVVWTPPGVRHWHGATASNAMEHLALQTAVDGRTVDWFEHVDDATYDPGASAASTSLPSLTHAPLAAATQE